VATRTFAVFHLGSFARRGFDLYADERSQLYKGVAGEHDLSDQAVKKTSGLVVTHRRKPILALYSSTCGGMTDSYSAVFQKEGFPYLKGGAKCDDRDSPFHSWEERVPSARVTANLKGKPPIGDLRKIEPLKRGVSGRVVEMRLTGSRGQTVLKGNEVRFVLGLRSNLITTVKAIRDKRGNVKELRVKGKGWGHGVGLCQYGAVNLAAKGVKFEGILKHYYRDVSITRQ
jgi:stage II sporulation protein D